MPVAFPLADGNCAARSVRPSCRTPPAAKNPKTKAKIVTKSEVGQSVTTRSERKLMNVQMRSISRGFRNVLRASDERKTPQIEPVV